MNSLIDLPADGVRACVQKRVEELSSVIDALEDRLDQAPEGALCTSVSHGKLQWHCFAKGVKRYLPMSDLACIKELAQKKYVKLVLESLRKQRASLDRLLQDYRPDEYNEVYASMRPEFQDVVTTVFPSREEFAAAWKSVRYRGKSLEGATLMSVDGVKVRSKSEMMIANALSASGVPYRYEFPYKMNWRGDSGVHWGASGCDAAGRTAAGRTAAGCARRVKVFPDFTCLNPRTRQEFVWEHFGKMDDADYVWETIEKLDVYERNGLLLGENFVFTMETGAHPLDSRRIQAVIDRYLK